MNIDITIVTIIVFVKSKLKNEDNNKPIKALQVSYFENF